VNSGTGKRSDCGLPRRTTNTECILVVDENPTNVKLVSYVLELEGYRVLTASDAEEAQEIMKYCEPNLILMDIALPGIDGLTLTRQLKADARTQHIIVVALTAFAMKGDERKAVDAGCDGYITKPIDTRSLGHVIAEFLAGGQTRNPAEKMKNSSLLKPLNPPDSARRVN
jgi:two-component system, cell cycle response regulator DivK